MNKKEFTNQLEDKLCFLVEYARLEEIHKYENVVDNYINMGQTEENAVASLGNIDDLVTAIYLSHGLDYKKLFTNKLTSKSLKSSFKNFYFLITGNDKRKAKNAIFYFLYLILFIILLKIVFIFVRDMGSQIFSDLINDKTFSKIYYVSFEVFYVFVAIIVFFKMFSKKFN